MSNEKKLIVAIVRPYLLDRIVVALEEIEDFPGMTVWDSSGFSFRLGNDDAEIDPFKPNKTIGVIAEPGLVPTIREAILKQAKTGKVGDGILFVVPLESVTQI